MLDQQGIIIQLRSARNILQERSNASSWAKTRTFVSPEKTTGFDQIAMQERLCRNLTAKGDGGMFQSIMTPHGSLASIAML